MLAQQISFLIIYGPSHPPYPSLSFSLSYQGDAGETGEPGLQGEVGPPVRFTKFLFLSLHQE